MADKRVHISRTPCTLATGRARLEGDDSIRWVVWDDVVEDGLRDEDGRRCIGVIRAGGMHPTFEAAIAYATTLKNGD